MRFGKPLQRSLRRAILRIRGNLPLFFLGQRLKTLVPAAESQFAVKPESPGIDRLVVVLPDLIRIDRDRGRARERAKTAQSQRVNPGSFALPVSVESVEANFDPFAQPDGFDVINGNAILESESRNVCAQRQSPRCRKIPEYMTTP